MIRKFTTTIALLASLALSIQSVLASDHIHLDPIEIQSCLVHGTSGSDDAIDVLPATFTILQGSAVAATPATRTGSHPLPRPDARGPPVIR